MLDTIKTLDIKKDIQYLKTGLILPEDLSREEWAGVGIFLKTANAAVQWWLGDWALFGERKYGETYTQMLDMTDYKYQSLNNFTWVAKKIEFSRRLENLDWNHHQEVAALPSQQQDYWLRESIKQELSISELRRAIKGGIKENDPLLEGDFSWFKDPEYKKAQEFLKPEYRHFLDRLNDKDETSSATQYAAHMEYRWMVERCAEIERKWGLPT